MAGYDYPPSKLMLSFGQVEEGSHFYGKGVLVANGKRYKCEFEVSYTQNCEIVLICYLSQAVTYNDQPELIAKFLGREAGNDHIVTAENLFPVRSLGRFKTNQPPLYIVVFRATCFKVVFSQSNFSSPEPTPHFEITNIKLPNKFDPNDRGYDQDTNRRISFSIPDDEEFLALLFWRNFEQRAYDNQPTVKLAVRRNKIPADISEEKIADIWCCLMSLAMGIDIQWTAKDIPDKEKMWHERKINGQANFLHLITSHLLSSREVELIQYFIGRCFLHIFTEKRLSQAVLNYVSTIRMYVEYITTRTSTAEGTARLITTLVEELLSLWEKNEAKRPVALLAENELKNLRKIMKIEMETRAKEYLIDDVEARLPVLLKRVVYEVINTNNINYSLAQRMENFFSECQTENHQLQRFDPERIKKFVGTRNKIAHEGSFKVFKDRENQAAPLNPEEKRLLRLELMNMRMMFPLMILYIFGYEGWHFDHYKDLENAKT